MATATSSAEVKTAYAAARSALNDIHNSTVLSYVSDASYGDLNAAQEVRKAARAALDILNGVEPLAARLP